MPEVTSLSRPSRELRLAAGGAGRGRAPPRTFQACLPHKVGLCLGLLAPNPGEQQRREREGKGAAGRRGLGAQGSEIPGLARLSGGTGGTWRGTVPAKPKRGAEPQAQPSWRAVRAKLGDRAEITERQAPAAASPLATSCSIERAKDAALRAPAAKRSEAGRVGRERRSSGSARGGGWNRLTKPGRARVRGSPGRATAREGAAHRPIAASRLGEAEATAAAGRVTNPPTAHPA